MAEYSLTHLFVSSKSVMDIDVKSWLIWIGRKREWHRCQTVRPLSPKTVFFVYSQIYYLLPYSNYSLFYTCKAPCIPFSCGHVYWSLIVEWSCVPNIQLFSPPIHCEQCDTSGELLRSERCKGMLIL